MFILYAITLAIVLGYVAGGRLEGLAAMRFRWAPVALAGLFVQVLVFGPLENIVGAAGPPLYLGSTLAVLAAVTRNIGIPGLPAVVVGATSNLAAILANGGVMPTDPGAAALAGLRADAGFSNSAVVADPALRPLTDIFAIPAGFPLANVFSVGDVLIAIGIVIAIVVGMRRGRPKRMVHADNSYD